MVVSNITLFINIYLIQFSKGWLQKFKERNGIHQVKLHGEADSADDNAIAEALPLLQSKCAEYPPDQIYNMDEAGLFYQQVLFCINANANYILR